MESKLFTSISNFVEKVHSCNSCLGRQYGNLLTGLTNAERGTALKTFLAMEWEINHRLAISSVNKASSLLSKDFPVGVRSIIASTKLAKEKGLAIAAGFQQRWMPQYIDLIDRARKGQLGQIASAQAYWAGDMVKWHWQPRKPEWSDMVVRRSLCGTNLS